MLILAILALLLPGLAWWAWFGKREEAPLILLSKSIGVSLASIALLAEAAFFLKISFSFGNLLILLAGFMALVVGGWIINKVDWPGFLAGGVLFILACAWRWGQASDLLLPNWVDSQHHYLIIRTILENRGLPADLSPYLKIPFYYHFGFHTAAALFTALSDLSIGASMLILGQILNACIGLSVYALGRSLWSDWRPAALAGVLISFLTQMPAYYLTWGRYTLISGLVLLPLAIAAALNLLKSPRGWQKVLLLAILTAGILLTHYFAAFLLAIFLICLGMGHLVRHLRSLPTALKDVSRTAAGAGAGLLLSSPWLRRVIQFSNLSVGIKNTLPDSLAALGTEGNAQYIAYLLGPGINYALYGLALLGLIWSLFQRQKPGFRLWTLFLAILTLPLGWVLKPFRPDHYAIVLFLPAVLWLGWLIWQLGKGLARITKQQWSAEILLGAAALAAIVVGMLNTADVINSVTVLVSKDDLQALNWIEDNTSPEARFFINTAHWMGGNYRGVDGGGWILPYTSRWALVPTIFYGFANRLDLIQQYQSWGAAASQVQDCSAPLWQLVTEADLDYLYIRQGTGRLQPQALAGCEGLTLVFRNAAVFIFEINPQNGTAPLTSQHTP